jgi:hypothetical protein
MKPLKILHKVALAAATVSPQAGVAVDLGTKVHRKVKASTGGAAVGAAAGALAVLTPEGAAMLASLVPAEYMPYVQALLVGLVAGFGAFNRGWRVEDG